MAQNTAIEWCDHTFNVRAKQGQTAPPMLDDERT